MDEQNGECSDHPDDLYGSVNPLDFLLEPEVSSRNVPCSNLSNDIGNQDILNNCVDSKGLPSNSFPIDSDFAKCVETISHSVNTSGSAAVNNCSDVFSVLDQGSTLKPENNLDLLSSFGDCEPHRDFSLSSLDGLDEAQHNKSVDSFNLESELSGLNSDVSPVQTYISDCNKSTNFSDESPLKEEPKSVGHDSECNSQDTQDEECDEKETDIGNGHYSAVQSATRTKSGSTRGRKRKSGDDLGGKARGGGAVKKRQPAVTYHSQISPDQNGIKLKIKKSSGTSAVQRVVKRRERTKKRRSKKDDEEVEDGDDLLDQQPAEQSRWGNQLPVPVLIKVFSNVTKEEGCLPFLVRASSVCHLWREAALAPSLWNTIDLTGGWVRDRYKSEAQLAWLCEHRLTLVEDLNAGGWKIADKLRLFHVMAEFCKNLRGITLTGWTGLLGDHLNYLVENCPLLSRFDLTSICRDGSLNRSAVSLTAMRNMCQIVGDRLTHLIIADNKTSGMNQIVNILAATCPNLEVFDISNIWNYSVAVIHIERFQEGCQKLRVLRLSNSNVCLAPTSLNEQVSSPGFPCLEELSIATRYGLEVTMQRPIMDDNSLERILKTSHKLRLLDVRGCARISDSSLVRVPAWDLEHLFLSGCYVTKMNESGLELIIQKWSHSLIEMDLGWCTATSPLDSAVTALAERGEDSPLRVLNLCGSSVSLEPVKAVLTRCTRLTSLNLASCRALPRGMKRFYKGAEVSELRNSLLEKPDGASSNSASGSPSNAPAKEAAANDTAGVSSKALQEEPKATMQMEESEHNSN